jgi:outer membrane protein OmpA-like peptidoglycan-associated protein
MSTMTLSTGSGRLLKCGLLLVLTLTFTACAWSNKAKGTAVGVATGAAVGGVIGNQTGSTARGAIIGATVGGAAGALIGHRMDQQAKELEYLIPGAVVTRVGEGIVVTFDSGLLYDFDSSAIRAEAGRNLQNLAASLKNYPNTDLLIVGHTDSSGSTTYNQDLSLRRADAASQYLAMQGVSMGRMHTSGRGETEAVASNDTESGRQLNRRIEVAIYATASARKGSP